MRRVGGSKLTGQFSYRSDVIVRLPAGAAGDRRLRR